MKSKVAMGLDRTFYHMSLNDIRTVIFRRNRQHKKGVLLLRAALGQFLNGQELLTDDERFKYAHQIYCRAMEMHWKIIQKQSPSIKELEDITEINYVMAKAREVWADKEPAQ